MRAQMSLEYLALSLVALSLLSISALSLLGLKDYAFLSSENLRFRSSASSLGNAMAEVCSLGPGNRLSVILYSPLEIRCQEEGQVLFEGSREEVVRPIPCGCQASAPLEGAVVIENENGIVGVRAR